MGSDIDWDTVSAAHSFAIALKKDGTLWGWGNNEFSQFGDTFYTTDHYTHDIFPYPIQIGADNDWKYISAGVGSIVAIKKDGTLWSWGSGSIPNTLPGKHFIPIQIGTDTDWESVSTGAFHNLALKQNGTLWAWGENGRGELGVGSILINNTTLVQVGTDFDWRFISAGNYHNAAIKTNGTLWTWGQNTRGQLGKGQMTTSSDESDKTPAQVGNATDWIYVSAGATNTAGIQSDGTLSTWGDNSYQQLGRATPTGTQEWSIPGPVGCNEPIPPIANCDISILTTTEICEYNQSITLSPKFQDWQFSHLSAISSVQWTSSGTGTFSQSDPINTTYTISNADRANGSISFTVVANGLNCTDMTATNTILINKDPSVEVMSDQQVCGNSVSLEVTALNNDKIEWNSSGTGTFSTHGVNDASVMYNASIGDLTTGKIRIYAFVSRENCPVGYSVGSSIDFLNSINAGLDQTICEGNSLTIESASAINVSTINWSTNGSGIFLPNTTTINPVYQPSAADVALGVVTLTLSSSANTGCSAASDQMLLHFKKSTVNAKADAGPDQTICGNTASLYASVQYASGGKWTSNGSGTFDPGPNYLYSNYILSNADIISGKITLTLTTTGMCSSPASDNITIFTSSAPAPQLSAGADQAIQETDIAYLYGYSESASNATWSSSGSGIFSDKTSLYATYTPSVEDITEGWVELTLSTTDNSICSPIHDKMYLAIGTTYSIRGFVFAGNNNVLDKGTANLFKETPSGLTFIRETTIVSGLYNFHQLPQGTYYIQGVPAQNSIYHNLYLPTFSGGKSFWTYYEPILIGSIDVGTALYLTPVNSSNNLWNTGNDLIAGIILTPISQATSRLFGQPTEHITVFLTDAQGDTLSSTQTDANGRYSFNNLLSGDYKIIPYYPELVLANNKEGVPVSVDGNPNTVENVSLQLSLATSIIQTKKSIIVNSYPNPANDIVSIKIPSTTYGTGEITLIDELGNIHIQKQVNLSESVINIHVGSLPSGMYILQVSSDQEKYTSKIVKF